MAEKQLTYQLLKTSAKGYVISSLLIVFCGSIVGLSLGLTGGGGAIFAVPLLIYVLGVPTREAVGISLIAVGITSSVGFFHRLVLGEVELRIGFLFALAGMLGSPLGTWVSTLLSDNVLLLFFAALMVLIATLMWRKGSQRSSNPSYLPQQQACPGDPEGKLILTLGCFSRLLLFGAGAGFLSGMFGIGGGFIIVPSLVLLSGMPIHRAVGTSLMVVVFISATGVISQLAAGRTLPFETTTLFVIGGMLGVFFGQRVSRMISSSTLQRVFAGIILLVAVYMTVRELW